MAHGIELERGRRSATLILDKPPLQILDIELLAELETMIDQLAGDDELQVVFLRSRGEKAFSAGVSIHDHTPDKVERMLLGFHGALGKLRALDAFSIALVDGHCLGGGFELARTCDYLLATSRARFALPEIKLGCFPPVAAAALPTRIGLGRTLDLILSGRTIDAAEAERLGLVEALVEPGQLAAAAERLTAPILEMSAAATRLAKRAARAGSDRPFAAALADAERLYLADLARSEDMTEGIEAFLAKRPPAWRHR
jgi:cyclohexa-1,5-dienecarbonyl-CoA hydratase